MALLKLFFVLFVVVKIVQADGFSVLYEWKLLDFAFLTDSDRLEHICDKTFIVENNVITGLGRWRNKIFVAIPRQRLGVPATLAALPYDASMRETLGAKLVPWPSWEMNQLGNCSALQNVNSVAVDTMNRLWVIDTGRTNILGTIPDNTCPPKLVVFDLNTGRVVKQHIFPEDCASRNRTVLSRIVIAVGATDTWAYISDSGDAKLIVYNLNRDHSWYIRHDSMRIDPSATNIRILGKDYRIPGAIDGLALSPVSTGYCHLFYTPLSSLHLYRLNIQVIQSLLTDAVPGLILSSDQVTDLGLMLSQTDGMVNAANGILYYGQLGLNAVYKWNSSLSELSPTNQILVIRDDVALQWPADVAIDDQRNGFVVSNRYQNFYSGTVNCHEVNIRIVRFRVGSRSYLYPN